MLKIFSRTRKALTPIKKRVEQNNRIVAEIHNSFFIASELALAEANRVLESVRETDTNKTVAMLRERGFKNTEIVKKYEVERDRVNSARINKELITKYAEKYPQYKFILLDDVQPICKKYNLVFGTVDRYLGDIPPKNIQEIVDFTVDDSDIYFYNRKQFSSDSFSPFSYRSSHLITKAKRNQAYFKNLPTSPEEDYMNLVNRMNIQFDSQWSLEDIPMYICANAEKMQVGFGEEIQDGFRIGSAPDPIVLHFVPGGFLIVSKWGIEANDQSLVNEKMN